MFLEDYIIYDIIISKYIIAGMHEETVKYNITIPLIYSKKYNNKEKKNRFDEICNEFD